MAFVLLLACPSWAQPAMEIEFCPGEEEAVLTAPYSDNGYTWILGGQSTPSIRVGRDLIGKEIVCLIERKLPCECNCENKDCGSEYLTISHTLSAEDFQGMQVQPLAKDLTCHQSADGVISLDIEGGEGPYMVQWSDGYNGENRRGLAAGQYKATVTDGNYCSQVITASLNEPKAVDLSPLHFNTQQPFCQGSSNGRVIIESEADLQAYRFEWDSGQEGPRLQNVPSGFHQVRIHHGEACTDQRIQVRDPKPVSATVEIATEHHGSAISCPDAADGQISLHIKGGQPPYQLQWNESENIALGQQRQWTKSSLAAGTYQVQITDGNGCSAQQQIVLTNPEPVQASLESSTYGEYQLRCSSDSSGFIRLHPSGGSGSYSYEWKNTRTGQTYHQQHLDGLSAGRYAVTVEDQNGCRYTNHMLLKRPRKLNLSLKEDKALLGKGKKVKLKATGGTGPYLLNDQPMGSSEVMHITESDQQTWQIEDANGCVTERVYRPGRIRSKKQLKYRRLPKSRKKRRMASRCPVF
ncbi:MAG: SprB repeat-containing protein [Bacteroidota bacterium]